jgi:protein-tyrosine phosphatase
LDEPVYIVDINLLDNIKPSEVLDTRLEEKFFEANPEKGKVWRWPLLGNLVNPQVLPDWLLKAQLKLYKHFNWDKLTELLPTIHAALAKPWKMSIIYLIHCEGGQDRTGEVAASYMIQYKNYTGPEAYAWDIEIATRDINFNSLNGLRWYCYYLTYEKNMKGLGCDKIKN